MRIFDAKGNIYYVQTNKITTNISAQLANTHTLNGPARASCMPRP